ncbi:tyrosine recombinase XerC [Nocardia terpenica]|uniref:site-specific integrase n=1 Tax=Nocardia terpenica TaxID=455432 RepID=UPI0003115FF9|nr:site-specific integrase [Nocardia terpenica]
MKSEDVDTALHLLARLGLTIEDLNSAPAVAAPVPTFASYIRIVSAAVSPSSRRNYGTYWRYLEKHWGSRPLDEPTATEIETLVQGYKQGVAPRANSRDGQGAARMFVCAIRCLYGHAERDGLISPPANPARLIDKPRQPDSGRHALNVDQILDLARIAATTGDDPELDALIVRLHLETACRRGGVLNLDIDDLDAEFCLVKLREKGGTTRWQPISPQLTQHLLRHVQRRGGTATAHRLLRYRNGRPVGRRRYDTLTQRLRSHLP